MIGLHPLDCDVVITFSVSDGTVPSYVSNEVEDNRRVYTINAQNKIEIMSQFFITKVRTGKTVQNIKALQLEYSYETDVKTIEHSDVYYISFGGMF